MIIDATRHANPAETSLFQYGLAGGNVASTKHTKANSSSSRCMTGGIVSPLLFTDYRECQYPPYHTSAMHDPPAALLLACVIRLADIEFGLCDVMAHG